MRHPAVFGRADSKGVTGVTDWKMLILKEVLFLIYPHLTEREWTNSSPCSGSVVVLSFVTAALLVDYPLPCAWTNSTTIFPEDRSLNGLWTAEKPRGSCNLIGSQASSETGCSRNSPICCAETNSSY